MSSVLILHQNESSQKKCRKYDVFQALSRKIQAKDISQAEDYIDAELFDIIAVYADDINIILEDFFTGVSRSTTSGLILFTGTAAEDKRISLEKKGVFVLDESVDENTAASVVTLILANRNRFHKAENDFMTTQSSIEEEKLINRAKCILIQYLNMTESQAHRYIEKQSMNLRQSKSQTAESILKTYEN